MSNSKPETETKKPKLLAYLEFEQDAIKEWRWTLISADNGQVIDTAHEGFVRRIDALDNFNNIARIMAALYNWRVSMNLDPAAPFPESGRMEIRADV